MSFNPSIPRPGDLLSESQVDLLQNNGSLNGSFSRNHIPLDVSTNNGKHTFVELVDSDPVGTPPVPPLSSGTGTIYTKNTGAQNMFYTNGSTGNEYQLTNVSGGADFAKFGTNTTYTGSLEGGWTFLPGGLFLQYGYAPISAAGTPTPITFPISFNNPPFSITIGIINTQGNSPSANSAFVKDGTVVSSGFTATNSSGSSGTQIYWMAIGN